MWASWQSSWRDFEALGFSKSFQNEFQLWHHFGPFENGHFQHICVCKAESSCNKKISLDDMGQLVGLDRQTMESLNQMEFVGRGLMSVLPSASSPSQGTAVTTGG